MMSFSKFKLSKADQRTTPVPIAAALPPPVSTQDDSCVQHESPDSNRSYGSCRKSSRRYPGAQNGGTCLSAESTSSQGNLAKPSITPKHKRRRVMDEKQSTTCTSSSHAISAGCDLQTAQTKYMGAPSAATEAFARGPDDTGISHLRGTPWRQKLDYMVNHFCGPELAEQTFHQYIGKLVPTCPVVIFQPGTTADYVRKTKPLLFMAILSVAPAGLCTPDKHRQFALEARGFLAEVAILEGDKSLDIVQALLVVSFWYRAPDNYTRSNQNQLASVALSIAIDLGLDRVAEPRATQNVDAQWNRAEGQRTWLGCFLLCASLSLIMRRPNPIVWNSQLDDYLNHLKQSKLCPTDDFFCKIVTMEHTCHVADKELSLSDPGKSVHLWDPKTLLTIQSLPNRVDKPPHGQHNPLENALVEFGMHAISLYANELALHENHNIDEFKAPFSTRSLRTYSFINMHASAPGYPSIIRDIILAAQGLLDIFISLSTSEMLALPPHIYAGRVIYAVILLMKLHKALSASACTLGEDISVDQLRLEDYIERLLLVSKRLIAEDERSSLSRAFLILPQLKEWLRDHPSNPTVGTYEPSAESCSSMMPAVIDREEIPQSLPAGLGALEAQFGDTLPQDGLPDNADDLLSRELASDSWFWEFFNVDMLH